MAVDVIATPQVYQTDGASTAFVVPWRFDDPADLQVVVEPAGGVHEVLKLDADYAIKGDTESGFWIDLENLFGPPADGGRLILARRGKALQQIPFRDQTKFPAARVASMGDRAARASQDIDWSHQLSLRLPVTDYPELKTLLPHRLDRVSKRLGFDDSGQPALFDADLNLRLRHNGDTVLDGLNDLDVRGAVDVLVGADKRAVLTFTGGGSGGGQGPGGATVGELEAWLSNRLRQLQTEVGNLHNTITQMQFGDWLSRSSIRTFVVETEANITAAYLQAIIAETGPGSALAGRIETVEAAIADPSTGLNALANSFTLIEARVTTSESNIAIQASQLAATQADLNLAETNIAANASTLTLHTSQITSIEGDVASQATLLSVTQADVSAAEANIAANASTLTLHTSQIATIDGDVTALSSQVNTVQATADSANASATSALAATASINGKLNATWQVELNANGKMSGVKAYNDGATSAFDFLSDRFSISNPSGGGTVTPFRVEGGAVYIDEANITNLIANNFAMNAGVSIGATGASNEISMASSTFANMPGMFGLTRVFDEPGVALIFAQFSMWMSNENNTGIIRVQNTGPNGTRFLNPGPFTHHTWAEASRPAFISGVAVAQFNAGTHTFNFQWQRLAAGTLFCDYRRVVIIHFKGASFSGITGSSGSSGGGSGSGGGNWDNLP